MAHDDGDACEPSEREKLLALPVGDLVDSLIAQRQATENARADKQRALRDGSERVRLAIEHERKMVEPIVIKAAELGMKVIDVLQENDSLRGALNLATNQCKDIMLAERYAQGVACGLEIALQHAIGSKTGVLHTSLYCEPEAKPGFKKYCDDDTCPAQGC